MTWEVKTSEFYLRHPAPCNDGYSALLSFFLGRDLTKYFVTE